MSKIKALFFASTLLFSLTIFFSVFSVAADNSEQLNRQTFVPSEYTVEKLTPMPDDKVLTIYIPLKGEQSILDEGEIVSLRDYQIELFTLVAKKAGIDYQVKVIPHDQIEMALAHKEYAIATSLPFHTLDKHHFSYSLPYAEIQVSEFQRVNKKKSPNVLLSNKEYQRVKHLLTDHQVHIYHNKAERNQMIQLKQIDIIRSPYPLKIRQKFQELGIESEFTEFTDINNPALMRAVTHISHSELLRKFNVGLRQIANSELNHLSETYLQKLQGQVADRLSLLVPGLSAAEEAFSISTPYVDYIAEQHHSAPYIFVDDTRISGYWVEVLHQISLRTGLVFRPFLVNNLKEGVARLEDNKSQVFTGIVNPDLNSDSLSFSIPYDTYSQQIISPATAPLTSLNQLRGKRVAAVEGFRIGPLVKERYPEIEIIEYDNTEESLYAVSEGRVAAALGNAFAATYQAHATGQTNLHFSAINSLKNEKFNVHMATPKQETELISLLNKGLKLTDGKTISELKQTWNNFSFDTSYLERSYRIKLFFVLLVLILVLLGSFGINRFTRRKMAQEQRHHEYTRLMLDQVEQAKQQVVKANKEQSYFFARMTHEIRTPLNGLFGMAEALAMSDLSEQQRQNLTILQQSGKNLVAILDDILDLSKMDSGNLSLKYKPCDIEQQLNSCLAAFGERAKAKKLDLRLALESKLASAYLVDPLRLTQIVNNLISNAIKFTDSGHVVIQVKKLDNDKGLEFVVSDSGVGIPADKRDTVFNAYRQANDDVQSVYGGTGLGLSICKELVTQMGGKIWVNSEESIGSNFHFQLPLKATNEKPHEFIDKNTVREGNMRQYPDLKLLLVEDNLVNQKVLSEQLKLFKIYPDIANNGAEAWEMYQAKEYDVVLSDCHMPVMDGFELARKITASKDKKTARLIAITADALNGADNLCFDAGFNDYLKKPINRFQLAGALNKAIQSSATLVQGAIQTNHEHNQTTNTNNFTLINTEMVSDLCAGDEQTIKSMLTNFLETVGEYDKIESLAKTDRKNLDETVHKLKGSSQYFGAEHLVMLCRKITEPAISSAQKNNFAAQIKAQLALMTQEAKGWLKELR